MYGFINWVVTYTACPLRKTYLDSQNICSDGAKIGRKFDTCKKVTENFVVSYYFCTFAIKYWLIVVNDACSIQVSLGAGCRYDFGGLLITAIAGYR